LSAAPVIWWPTPAPGDIVWCWWPNDGRNRLPGPKPRPCLILALDEKIVDQPHVLVAYGTSQRVTQLRSGEFAISNAMHPAAFNAAGLSYDTKFLMGQTAWLPYSTLAFGVAPGAPHGQLPKLGILHPSMVKAATAAYAAAWP
jgi:hypothetical protein